MATEIVRACFPGIPEAPGLDAVVCVVLTKDDCGKYACYIGIVSRSATIGADEPNTPGHWWVASSGAKLNVRRAGEYFSGLNDDNYRH